MAGAERVRTRMARDTGPLLDRGRRRNHSHEALGQRALRRANHSAQDSCAITRIPQACGQSESSSAVENVPNARASIPDPSLLDGLSVDDATAPVSAQRGGTQEALTTLRRFIDYKLKGYSMNRNQPD